MLLPCMLLLLLVPMAVDMAMVGWASFTTSRICSTRRPGLQPMRTTTTTRRLLVENSLHAKQNLFPGGWMVLCVVLVSGSQRLLYSNDYSHILLVTAIALVLTVETCPAWVRCFTVRLPRSYPAFLHSPFGSAHSHIWISYYHFREYTFDRILMILRFMRLAFN